MNDYSALYTAILDYWNDFASRHGYDQVEKTNDRIRKVVKRRIRAEEAFLHRMPAYFDLIHKHCGRTDEFGKPLNLHSFLRSTTTLRAILAERGE